MGHQVLRIRGTGAGFLNPALLWPQGSLLPSREAEIKPDCQGGKAAAGKEEGGSSTALTEKEGAKGPARPTLRFPQRLQLSLLARPAPQLSSHPPCRASQEAQVGILALCPSKPGLGGNHSCRTTTVTGTGSTWDVGGSQEGAPCQEQCSPGRT